MSAAAKLAALAAIVAAALAVAGCGEDSEVSPPAGLPGAIAGGPDPEALQAFQDCMREQGVEVPDGAIGPGPGEPPGGDGDRNVPQAPSDEQQRAMEACRDELPAPPGGAPGFSQEAPAPPG